MNEEQTLNPVDIGKLDKQGNPIFNLNLKTKVNKATGAVSQGLLVGNYIVVEKLFKGGFQTKFDYSIKVKYADKECSFFLSEKWFPKFEETGGIGDKVKITAIEHKYQYQGEDKTTIGFDFELVE